MKTRAKLLAGFIFMLSVLTAGCVGGGTDNQNAAAANANKSNENRVVNPLTEPGMKPNIQSISMMINAAAGSLKEGNWEQAAATLEEALKRAGQGKADPGSAILKPEFEEVETMIKDALDSARKKDQAAIEKVERLKAAASTLVMKSQSIAQ